MCGNFSLAIDEAFYPRFNTKSKIHYVNDNIRPTTQAPIITHSVNANSSENEVQLAEWSLMPKELEGSRYSTFNARLEGLLDSRLYKEPFLETRCIVPMNNYFEWHKRDSKETKEKYKLSLESVEYIGVAGLFKIWNIHDKQILCFTIITAPAAESISEIHDRMPIILNQDDERVWLDPDTKLEDLQKILQHSRHEKYRLEKM